MTKQPEKKYLEWNRLWWIRPIVPALERMRQEDYHEFETILGPTASAKRASGVYSKTLSKKLTSSIEQVVPACKHISWAALFFLGVKPSVCFKTTNLNKHFSTFWLELGWWRPPRGLEGRSAFF